MYEETLWISHSALSAYEKCPHLYYLEYRYKNPATGNRIQIINPYLSLGSAVHETIEGLLDFPEKERKNVSLPDRYERIFDKYRGLRGGFISQKKEEEFYNCGVQMIQTVTESDFLSKPSLKLNTNFPTLPLFEKKELGIKAVLVGSIDWVQLLPSKKAHIIDFKTGNSKEVNGSLQLPIYALLAENNLTEEVEMLSYWYLQHDKQPVAKEVKNTQQHLQIIKEKTKEIWSSIEDNSFSCNFSGKCFACRDYEKIFNGEAEMISSGEERKKDVFCVFKEKDIIEKVTQEEFLDEREKKIFELRMETTLDNIGKELRLNEEKLTTITTTIKDKLKKNLHPKELKVVIKMLQSSS